MKNEVASGRGGEEEMRRGCDGLRAQGSERRAQSTGLRARSEEQRAECEGRGAETLNLEP